MAGGSTKRAECKGRRGPALLVAVSTALFAGAVPLQALAQTASKSGALSGKWQGTYVCGQGTTGLTFELRPIEGAEASLYSAVFEFFPLGRPMSRLGAFRGAVTVNAAGTEFEMRPESWIYQPSGFSMVGMRGRISASWTLEGQIVGVGCQTFSLGRSGTEQAMAALGQPGQPPATRQTLPLTAEPAPQTPFVAPTPRPAPAVAAAPPVSAIPAAVSKPPENLAGPTIPSDLLYLGDISGVSVLLAPGRGCDFWDRPIYLVSQIEEPFLDNRFARLVSGTQRMLDGLFRAGGNPVACPYRYNARLRVVGAVKGVEVLRAELQNTGQGLEPPVVTRRSEQLQARVYPGGSLEEFYLAKYRAQGGELGATLPFWNLLRDMRAGGTTPLQRSLAAWEFAQLQYFVLTPNTRIALERGDPINPNDPALSGYVDALRQAAELGHPAAAYRWAAANGLVGALRAAARARGSGQAVPLAELRRLLELSGSQLFLAADSGDVNAITDMESARAVGLDLTRTGVALSRVPSTFDVERALNRMYVEPSSIMSATYSAILGLPPGAVINCDGTWCNVGAGVARMRWAQPMRADCIESGQDAATCDVIVKFVIRHNMGRGRGGPDLADISETAINSLLPPARAQIGLQQADGAWHVVAIQRR